MGEITRNQDTRRAFIDTLIELAEKDDRIVLIVPDVGFLYIEKFQERFPNRFFNLGVTEASIMCIAAGLATSGLKPYVYSMLNFTVFRPFEMVRNMIALPKLPVTLVGVKGSSAYKFLGWSHNMVFEDEDMYHLTPYMECYLPVSNEEVREDLLTIYNSNQPGYIRL